MGDDLTYEQLLAMLKGKYAGRVGEGVMDGVGAKGLDTPAERDLLAKEFGSEESDSGLIDAVINYKNTSGSNPLATEKADYDMKMSYIDKDPTLGGLDSMRALQLRGAEAGFDTPAQLNAFMRDPTANTRSIEVDPNSNITNLGMGGGFDRGFETPAAREFAGTGESNMDVDRASFNTNFENLTPEQKAQVTEMMAGMTDAQKKAFALGMTKGKVSGYELGEQNRLAY